MTIAWKQRGMSAAVVAALIGASAAGPPARAEEKPNVLLVLVDDLNDWVGCLGGHPQASTPRMDALAAAGTVFRNAHCQAPLCNPSRTSLLTGRRPSSTGVYALDPWFRSSPSLANLVTLPQAFRHHGYRTILGGKVFHDAYPPADRRADGSETDEWGYHGGAGPLPEHKLVETPSPIAIMDWGVFPDRDEEIEDSKVADWAIDRLSAPPDGPWFLAVGFRRPHVPCFAPQKWFDAIPQPTILPPFLEDDRDDVPPFAWFLHWRLPEPRLAWLRRAGQWEPLVRAYLASTSYVDSQVGRVLDALDASGLRDRTIIVLASDHGWHLGEKGITGKNSLWERSTRVPLIFAGPGVKAAGVCRSPAELLDLYPTLLELCGLPGDPSLEGHSLAPQLADDQSPRPWPALTTHGPGNHAVRTDRHRLIHYADGSEELYDLASDPNEWTNLATDPAHDRLRRELAAWLPRVNVPPIPGSKTRLLERTPDGWTWEGVPILPADPVPMDDVP